MKTNNPNEWKMTKSSAKSVLNINSKIQSNHKSNLDRKVADNQLGVRAPKSSLDEVKKVYVSPFLPGVDVTDIMDHLNAQKP